MKNSNRSLSKLLNRLNRIAFSKYKKGYFNGIKAIKKIPYEIFDLEPNPNSYVYRALINYDSDSHYEKISRIIFNPNPQSISRANLEGQAVAYYACACDVSIMEACYYKLRSTTIRDYKVTVSKWKINKNIQVQIINSSSLAQSTGTDLGLYYEKCKSIRKAKLSKKEYRTWYLKSKFIAEQFAKEISSDMDYYLTARYSNQILDKTEIKGIVYPSIRYLYKGFNYAFSPQMFENNSFQLEEVSEYLVSFNKSDITKYPTITKQCSTSCFDGDDILW